MSATKKRSFKYVKEPIDAIDPPDKKRTNSKVGFSGDCPARRKKMRRAKRKLLKALSISKGLITIACSAAGFSGTAIYYDFYNNDPTFKKLADAIKEEDLDYTESKLNENVEAGKEASIFFKLKCLGKKRGFIERSEVDISQTGDPQSMVIGGTEIGFF